MNVAFIGKGGVGKSTIAGTFARLLARTGRPVLTLDCDPMPGLSYALGVPVQDVTIPPDAVTERPFGSDGPRFVLVEDPIRAVQRYAPIGPDGVRFLSFGKQRGMLTAQMRSQTAFRQIIDTLPTDQFDLVGDLPAGTRQPFFGWARFADTVVVVTDPSVKSIHTARRLAKLRDASWAPRRIVVVVNRLTDPSDCERVAEITGLEVIGALTNDPLVALADRSGAAPLDAAANGPFVRGVAELVSTLCNLEVAA